jgi:chemotaxis signal transduction protein
MVVDVPAGPEYLRGLVFWREIPVPVIDIAARLGFDPAEIPTPSNSRRFIIARHKYHLNGPSQKNGGRQSNRETSDALMLYAAFEVRSDVRIMRLPIESQVSTRSLPINPGMVLGQVELEDETLVIPDLKAVLSQDVH